MLFTTSCAGVLITLILGILGEGPDEPPVAPKLDPPPSESTDIEPDCGLKALYNLMHLSDLEVDYVSIADALPPLHRDGYAIGELRDAASRLGMRTAAYRLRLADLPRDRPSLARLHVPLRDAGHFVVFRPVGTSGRLVQMLSPPYVPRILDLVEITPRGNPELQVLVPVSLTESAVLWSREHSVVLTILVIAIVAGVGRIRSKRSLGPVEVRRG
jgi:ABC-type bacteriocin/lantibiotic exporter with double-glycine peptidase domain